MKVREAIEKFKQHAGYRMKPPSLQTYLYLLNTLAEPFGNREVDRIEPEEIRFFLDKIAHQRKQNTKHMRFTQVKAFFNYCIKVLKVGMDNPCKDEIISKAYRIAKLPQKDILKWYAFVGQFLGDFKVSFAPGFVTAFYLLSRAFSMKIQFLRFWPFENRTELPRI